MWDSPVLGEAIRRTEGRRPQAFEPGKRRAGAFRWRQLAAAAAVVLTLAGAATVADLPLHLRADHVADIGAPERVTLADGSSVVLDTGSALAADVEGTERAVQLLHGRAYFEVAPEDGRPFTVSAGGASVEVTGTAFQVARGDEAAAITVRHGSVRVSGSDGEDAALALGAGQGVRVRAGRVEQPAPADVASALAWTEGRLVFEDETLGAVAASLDRYHSGIILVLDAGLRDKRVTGSYRLDDPVRTAGLLADLAGARLTRLSDYVLIIDWPRLRGRPPSFVKSEGAVRIVPICTP